MSNEQEGRRHRASPEDTATTVTSHHHESINVTVRYAAAPRPFQDHEASRSETLASLLGRVLLTFGLTEGEPTSEGNVITYKLYDQKTELSDLTQTLGSLAGNAGALALKLSQVIQQGCCTEGLAA